jgi:hypothetical protein
MEKKIGAKRIFDAVAVMMLVFFVICVIKFTNGSFLDPLNLAAASLGNLFKGKFSWRGLAVLVCGVVFIVVWIIFFRLNIKHNTYHYLFPIHLSLMMLVLLSIWVERTTLGTEIKAKSGAAIGYVVFGALYVIFALVFLIMEATQLKHEFEGAPKEVQEEKKEEAQPAAVAANPEDAKENEDLRNEIKELADKVDALEKKLDEHLKEVAAHGETKAAVVAAPAKKAAVVAAPVEEGKKLSIIRRPFREKIVAADKGVQSNYNILKNEILSYKKAKSRISIGFDTFHIGKDTLVKIAVNNKSLKLYLAMDPKQFKNSSYPIEDASDHKNTEVVPSMLKVKSDLSVRRAQKLIAQVMEKNGAVQKKEPVKADYIKEIKDEAKK